MPVENFLLIVCASQNTPDKHPNCAELTANRVICEELYDQLYTLYTFNSVVIDSSIKFNNYRVMSLTSIDSGESVDTKYGFLFHLQRMCASYISLAV